MTIAALRRFVDLAVGEVSLVDSPANEEVFVVIKSLNTWQEDTMDIKQAEGTAEATTEENAEATAETTTEENAESGAEVVEVPVEAPADEAIQKAMDKVAATVEAIAKAAGLQVTEGEVKKATPAPLQDTGIRELFMSKLKKAGVKGEELKTAMDEFDAQAGKKVKKAGDELTDEPTEKAEDTISLLGQLTAEIEKAKRFTPKRAESLKAAIAELSKLATELTEDAEKTQLPGTGQFGDSGIKDITKAVKELADGVKAGLAEMVSTTKDLGERVEAIEKTRQPSQSVSDAGGTDAEVKKMQGLWSGLL